MRPSPEECSRFASSLTAREKVAVEAWLNMGATLFREFELYGAVPSSMTREGMVRVVREFGEAMEKALVCGDPVFRGLAAGSWRPDDMAYLRSLLEGPPLLTLCSYASASASGRATSARYRARLARGPAI
jgi:hypothetical protein